MANGSQYFPHDYFSRNDPKITKLIQQKGWDCLGLYWAINEMLHEQGGYLDKDYEGIAFALHTDKERIESIINFPDLFNVNGNKFTSNRVLKNLSFRQEKSEKAKESAHFRWNNANAKRTQCEGNAIKGKERKLKEIKEKSIPDTNHAQAIEYFCKKYEEKIGSKYVFNGGKDGELIKEMLKFLNLDQFKYKVNAFFYSGDDFVKKAGYTLGVFKSQINKIKGDKYETGIERFIKND